MIPDRNDQRHNPLSANRKNRKSRENEQPETHLLRTAWDAPFTERRRKIPIFTLRGSREDNSHSARTAARSDVFEVRTAPLAAVRGTEARYQDLSGGGLVESALRLR